MRIRDEFLRLMNSGKGIETFMEKIQCSFPGYDMYQLRSVEERDDYGFREKVGLAVNFFNRDWFDAFDKGGYEYLGPVKSIRITFPINMVNEKRFNELLGDCYGTYRYEIM